MSERSSRNIWKLDIIFLMLIAFLFASLFVFTSPCENHSNDSAPVLSKHPVLEHYVFEDADVKSEVIRVCIDGYSYLILRHGTHYNDFGGGFVQQMERSLFNDVMLPVKCPGVYDE